MDKQSKPIVESALDFFENHAVCGTPIFARITFRQACGSFWSRFGQAFTYLCGHACIDAYITRDIAARISAHYKVQALRQVDPEAEELLAIPNTLELNG
jgi:hypothetical protein